MKTSPYLRRIAFRPGGLPSAWDSLAVSTLPNETPIITQAKSLFSVIDGRFAKWQLTRPENIGSVISLAKFEIIKDFRFRNLLSSVSADFAKLALTKAQVVALASHSWKGFPVDPVTTYIPFKETRANGKDEYFLARIFFRLNGCLEIYAYRTDEDDDWSAELRPQLILPEEAVRGYDPKNRRRGSKSFR